MASERYNKTSIKLSLDVEQPDMDRIRSIDTIIAEESSKKILACSPEVDDAKKHSLINNPESP
jgi:hypothetical protein